MAGKVSIIPRGLRAHRPSCEGCREQNGHYLRGIVPGAVYLIPCNLTQANFRYTHAPLFVNKRTCAFHR